MKKSEKTMREMCERHGATILRYTGSGHYMIRRSDGALVTAGSTSSDHRALKNLERDLTRRLPTA